MSDRHHKAKVSGSWIKDQEARMVKLVDGVFKVTWMEPMGTDVALNFMPNKHIMHSVIFFPPWGREIF